MRRIAILASFCLAAACVSSAACSGKPEFLYQDPHVSVDRRTEDLLRRMTPEEKRDVAHGNKRLGIPTLHVETTGPASGLALVATWNPELVAKVAAVTPSAFGYYGEDPWLAARMAVAWTGAVQAEGRIGQMLNFPCSTTSDLGERVLNEIYFPPFRASIEEAGLWSVGIDGCPDPKELRDWGFRGFAMPLRSDAPDDTARRILRAMFAAGFFDPLPPQKIADPAERKRIERIAGGQSVVLLKNESGLLPLYAMRLKSIGVKGSKALAGAIRQRAGATPVIEGDGDIDIAVSGDRIDIFEPPRGRSASLAVWTTDMDAVTDVVFGGVNPSGKLPVTIPKSPLNARDGIYVGYRYFDKNNIAPLYPFGFGLSYTTFDWSDLRIFPVSPRYGQTVEVVVKVRNSGARAGTETVEVYVHQAKSGLERPPQELKAFNRVELKPGETKDVAVTLDRHSMSFYDPSAHDWAAEPGVFEVLVGASSRDIRLRGSFQLFP
jgi:hypothetical protein